MLSSSKYQCQERSIIYLKSKIFLKKGLFALKQVKFSPLSRIVSEPYPNSDIFEKSRPPPWVITIPKLKLGIFVCFLLPPLPFGNLSQIFPFFFSDGSPQSSKENASLTLRPVPNSIQCFKPMFLGFFSQQKIGRR